MIMVSSIWSQGLGNCLDVTQIFGFESVTLADRSIIQATIFAPRIEIGNDSKISGQLIATNQMTIRDRVTISGDVFWKQALQKGNQVSILGSVEQSATRPNCQIPSLSMAAGNQRIEIGNDQNEELAPGVYGELVVRARALLQIFPGTYTFSRLEVEPDAKLDWEVGEGENLNINVTGGVRIGDRAKLEGNKTIAMIAGQGIEVGADSWTRLDLFSPNSDIRIASRAQLGGRLLGLNIRLEPDVGAFGVPAFRPSALYDRVLISRQDTINWSDYRQALLRLQNPEAERLGAMTWETRDQLIEMYATTTDEGQIVPLLSSYKTVALQYPGLRTTRDVAYSALAETNLKTNTKMGLFAPLELQEMGKEAVSMFNITYDNVQRTLYPDSVVWIPVIHEGAQVIHIATILRSGKTFENYYHFTVEIGEAEEFENEGL
jgi:hypothetical protein